MLSFFFVTGFFVWDTFPGTLPSWAAW